MASAHDVVTVQRSNPLNANVKKQGQYYGKIEDESDER